MYNRRSYNHAKRNMKLLQVAYYEAIMEHLDTCDFYQVGISQ